MADRRARAAVLLSDSNTARLFVTALGAIEVRREVRSPALHKPKQAGELDSAAVQHHVEEVWRKHARQAVHVLEELVREEPVSWIVIAGEESIGAALTANLSPGLRDKLLPRQTWDMRIGESEISANVDALVEDKERERRMERARGLVERAGSGETVLGLPPVVEALRHSRVGTLVLSESLAADTPAWACRTCQAFGGGTTPEICPSCGAASAQTVPLREELASRALGLGAAVHFVEARAAVDFDERGGIGAELRY
jgi:peptide subunit release factor 1 (eRF1)